MSTTLKTPRKTATPKSSPPKANPNHSFSTIPQYTVKDVSDMLDISIYALRYYDRLNLFPYLKRDENDTRLFSEYDLEWVKIIHCLRCTGLPLAEIKHYVDLCLQGDATVPERAEIIFRQEETLRNNISELHEQLKMLEKKKTYYQALLENREIYDSCNPQKKRKA